MSTASDIQMQIDQQSVSGVMRELQARSKKLNEPLSKSVKMAAWAIADALRAATRISPKRRPVEQDPESALKDRAAASGLSFLQKGGKGKWKVHALRKGQAKIYTVRAADRKEAEAHRVAQIGNRGLAQKSWHWMQSRLGSSRGGTRVASKTMEIVRRDTSVELMLTGENPTVKITNRLPYAGDAFKTSGAQTLANVMERAARRLMHITDAQAAKAMK